MMEADQEETKPSSSSTSNKKRLPVLIIPGFMSSGLVVQSSNVRPDWVGERIWINLTSLGIQSFHFGKSVEEREDGDSTSQSDSDEVKRNVTYKSDWLQHMVLSNDLKTEANDVEVRNIEGLAGVDYLTPGTLTNHVSYVFGPVIDALREAGYVEGKDLQAAPYDWRLPPTQLEQRDEYFTRTMQLVKKLYVNNDKTPVVLLCHSLGCKTGHYFLNFLLRNKGRTWIDKYIHTYMPVGGPHLGAPKALRSVMSGDKMGLEAFLSDEEALTFGRSLGSGLWLFPKDLPEGAPSSLQCQPRGVLEITLMGKINVDQMLASRRHLSRSNNFKLSLVFNDVVVKTEYHRGQMGVVEFEEIFLFATDASGPTKNGKDDFQVVLLEPGVKASKGEKSNQVCCCRCLVCCFYAVTCIWICKLFCCLVKQSFILSAEALSRALGGSTILAASDPTNISDAVSSGHPKNDKWAVKLYFGRNRESKGWFCPRRNDFVKVQFRVEWKKHVEDPAPSSAISGTSVMHPKTTDGPTLKGRYVHNATDIMKKEGLDGILRGIKDLYDNDSLDPRGLSSVEAPPVSRVYAIYGINLPTEVGSVYARRAGMIYSTVMNQFDLDKYAKLDGNHKGYKLYSGILLETSKTKQIVASSDETEQTSYRRCSGDGTVPYWSLSHCRTWDKQCHVDVKEIDGAEHREILADKRFHEAIVNYVCKNA